MNRQGQPQREPEINEPIFVIDPEKPVYIIGVVSQLVELPVWTLRILDKEGIVKPKRTEGKTRLYCMRDLRRLARIRQLMVEEGVNVQGIRVILTMETYTEIE